MGEPAPGAQVARDLGIYLGQIYSYIKKGTVTNHKVGGYPDGKGIEVDPDEVKAAMSTSKRRGAGPGKGKSTYVPKAEREARRAEKAQAEPPRRRLRTGAIVSYDRGVNKDWVADPAKLKPHFSVAQVLGSTGHLTFLDDGTRRQYQATVMDNVVFSTERLSKMLARGVARIEHPKLLLGMIILNWMMEGEEELAASLERWMTRHEIDVIIPEIMDLEPEADLEEETIMVSSEGDDE